MNGAVKLSLGQFLLIYLLLIVVLFLMKRSKINQARYLLWASLRMTVQLVLVGFVLQYILQNKSPWFTVLFLLAIIGFSILRALSKNRALNKKFKLAVAGSLGLCGLSVLAYFVILVVGENFFNAQYTIPLAGMIIGNAMTGVSLALKTFMEDLVKQRAQMTSLLNLGVSPKNILKPFVSNALEVALLPTMNSMLGMGIIFLPGMMTGQILSGTAPTTAILYQIAIMIAICTSVCLTVFCALNIGYHTLYNKENMFLLMKSQNQGKPSPASKKNRNKNELKPTKNV